MGDSFFPPPLLHELVRKKKLVTKTVLQNPIFLEEKGKK